MVGLVRGVHGLNGALRVEVLTDNPEERFAPGRRLFREGGDAPLTIADAVAIPDGPGWRIRFAEVPDRTAAEALRGAYLEAEVPAADRSRRTAPTTGTRSSAVPSAASTARSSATVVDVYRVGENDVYVVRGGPRGEFDVPAVRGFIRVFEPREGRIVVDVDALDLGPVKPPRPPDHRARGAASCDRASARRSRWRGRTPPAVRRTLAGDAAGPQAEVDGSGPAPAMTLDVDILTLFPAMLEGPLAASIPAAHPGAGPGDDPDPRPAATGVSAGTARSTTTRTAAGPG